KPTYRSPLRYTFAVISIIIQIVLIYFTFEAYGWKGAAFSSGIILLGVPFYYYFYIIKKKDINYNNTTIA
ncbi:MAG: hypothetical protein JXA99_17665, partial [Candidatus Lokiarchaeota archaeon]|nr:hypothetical protein [Candidatus Lokiarchaeota archaeon]